MLGNLFRFLAGILLLPLCWASARVLFDSFMVGAGEWLSVEGISLFAGMAAFALCWATLSHPMRAYVLGHELTHALWGLIFGARPSDLKVGANGGSVLLTKTNVLITLAPYFFPFYTFVVILAAIVTYAFMRTLPYLPLWMFMIGFTWAFHVLFTFQTLTQRQPDVTTYGRLFSWTLIFLANVGLVEVWLACMTPLTFPELGAMLLTRTVDAYVGIWKALRWVTAWAGSRGARTLP